MKYIKTEAGQQAFKARSTLFSSRQRSAFILFDGVKSDAQVLAVTAGLGMTQDDIEHLVAQGFLTSLPEPEPVPVGDSVHDTDAAEAVAPSTRSPQERYMAAMPIATKLTAGLGLRGFRLNLAVEAANGVDGLLALLPNIQAAVGVESCVALERALKD